MREMRTIAVNDLSGPIEQYGHDELGGAFDEFSERWQHGIEVLITDGAAISGALRSAAKSYVGVDEHTAGGFDQSTGKDGAGLDAGWPS
jgi:hypothetical protein